MGLIGGVARTAVIAGTATAVSNRVSRRQARRWAAQEQQDEPDPYEEEAPAQDMSARFEQLKQLGDLKDQGLITAAEFEQQKARILG